ncbi:LLM class flavin-dependent oxidoreductase, partial [Dehalococcoidia bacterium]|nr:LLM class flavin-dependent oxidoreductase [Dehalococcoidia bacterium]
ESVTHHGRFYDCDDMVLDPKPTQQPIPMWVGGNTWREARWGFAIAEGWLPFAVPAAKLKAYSERARGSEHRPGHPCDLVSAIRPIQLGDELAQQLSLQDVNRISR